MTYTSFIFMNEYTPITMSLTQ